MCKLKRWLAMRWSHSAYGRTEMTMNGETALEQFLLVFSSNAIVFARMGFLVYTTQVCAARESTGNGCHHLLQSWG